MPAPVGAAEVNGPSPAPLPGRDAFARRIPVVFARCARSTTEEAEGNGGGWQVGEQANFHCPSGTQAAHRKSRVHITLQARAFALPHPVPRDFMHRMFPLRFLLVLALLAVSALADRP